MHIDPRSGAALWVRENFPRLTQFNLRDIPGTSYLVINAQTDRSPAKTRLQVLNIGTGQDALGYRRCGRTRDFSGHPQPVVTDAHSHLGGVSPEAFERASF